jgi:hypothetical protein
MSVGQPLVALSPALGLRLPGPVEDPYGQSRRVCRLNLFNGLRRVGVSALAHGMARVRITRCTSSGTWLASMPKRDKSVGTRTEWDAEDRFQWRSDVLHRSIDA